MNTPVKTDKIDEEETDKINIKVQGNDADSKKTFKVSKVNIFDNVMSVLAIGSQISELVVLRLIKTKVYLLKTLG